MEVLKSGLAGRCLLSVWLVLYRYYEDSRLSKTLRALSRMGARLWRKSALAAFLTRESALSRAWAGSAFCASLGLLVNLPVALLHWVYRRFRPLFDGSAAAGLAFGLGEQIPAATGWLFLAVMLIPHDNWNNFYGLVGFLLMLMLALAGGMRRRSLRLNPAAVGPYLALFAASVWLSALLSVFPALSLRFLFFHITCMLCVLVTVSVVERPEDLERLAGFTALGLAAMGAAAIVQRVQGVAVNASYVDLLLNKNMPGRVYAMFENPNAFAQVLAMLIPLSVGLTLGSTRWRWRFIGLLSTGLGGAAILMTYGRAAWLGLAAAALVFVFMWNRKLLPFMLLAGLAAVPLLPDSVMARIFTIFNMRDTSTSSRFPLYSATLRLLRSHPVLGAGLGSYAVRQAVKDLNYYHGVAPFVHAHNIYLQVWAETGLLGILSFLGAMSWTVKRAFRAVSSASAPRLARLLAMGGASALFGILVCGIADYIWNYPRVMLIFWFVAALTLSAARLCGRAGLKEHGGSL